MNPENACPAPVCAPGDEAHGFRLERVTAVPEIRATAYEAVHRATGARVLHLHCPDRENFYAVTLRTPPADSTGIAHILEHSALAGSHKYPVKDAFNELSKGSLRTFLNAFTAPDFTCYPVASQVKADFYNLASVYTDLVLNPLLAENTFRQEGHHLEVSESGELSISGIVYNEMKGVFTSAEGVAQRITVQGLFPDTPYGVESGGDPECIPDLTFEAFREFHRRYYSPSNARFYFYGDLPTPEHLAFLGERLRGFGPVEVDSRVPDQPRWTAPRWISRAFPIGPDDSEEARATVNLAWLTAGVEDAQERLVLEILEETLLGNAAAPLRKALVDSGLGQDLSPSSGLQPWFRQLPFVVGLRGTEAHRAEEITALALSTLESLATGGLPRELLEAAFHQVEFKGLEITRRSYSFPLVLLFRSMGTWLHDHDPLVPLRFPMLIAGLRKRWEADPDLFRQAVRRWLVDNPHRLCAVIAPSRTLSQEQETRLRERLRRRREGMTAEEVEEARAAAAALAESQRAEDSPEALASLPQLRIEEIPAEGEIIPASEHSAGGMRLFQHELFSNGIAYIDLAFDVSHVPDDLQPYLPLLGAASAGMGAAGKSYAEMATRQALYTGGVSCELKAEEHQHGQGTVQLFLLRSRALARNVPRMIEILKDIVAAGDLDDDGRLRDLLNEERNDLRAELLPRGDLFSWRSAAASLSLASHRDEQWRGVSQIRHLNELVSEYEGSSREIRGRLQALRQLVFQGGGVVVNVTGDGSCLGLLREAFGGLVPFLPGRGLVIAGSDGTWPRPAASLGVAIPGKVCYVARVLPGPRHNEPAAALVQVLASHLRAGILYRKIRVEGGAYGGHASYSPLSGQLALLSYRDPNLEKTLAVYDSCLSDFLREDLDADAMRKAVIGTIAGVDRPLDPATKGLVAMERELIGLSDADRQRFRQSILGARAQDLRRVVAEVLQPAAGRATQAVLAPKSRIEEANGILATPFEAIHLG